MYVRRLKITFLLMIAFGIGIALPLDVLSSNATRMLVTFLGLFSASIFPTITLLVNGMTTNGRSVKAIEELNTEICLAVDALISMFICIAIAFGSLVALSINPPNIFNKIPYLSTKILPHIGQAILFISVIKIIERARLIPSLLKRALHLRKEIAIEEARRLLKERTPNSEMIGNMFPTHPDFGKVINLDKKNSE